MGSRAPASSSSADDALKTLCSELVMEVLLLTTLILLNGLFAMSEIALVTAKRTRLARLADAGDGSAAAAIRLGEDPTRFLSTIQIGITSIGILNGIVGEAVFAAPFSTWLETLAIDSKLADILATVLVVIVITYFSIVIGELVPKRLGQFHPESIARIVARPMECLATATRPFVKLLSASTDTVLRVFGKGPEQSSGVTEEEIHALLAEGSESGVIERSEHQMVRNVFRLDERQIGSLMISRADIEFLDVTLSQEDNLKRAVDSEHSRFPVCQGGLDNVIGFVTAKQLLVRMARSAPLELSSQVQPSVFVPETLTGMQLLEHFRYSDVHMVLVVDEYGVVQGLVTLQDVLEAVTGEFKTMNQDDAWAVQRADGSWLLDGLIPVPELKDRLNLSSVPEEDRGRFHTLSGLLMWILGRLPRTGDTVTWEQWRFEVVDLDGKRIDKVLATRIDEQDTRATDKTSQSPENRGAP
jgi:putative hemolysin